MKIYIVLEHNWDDGMIFVKPYTDQSHAVKHFRMTRQLWSGHRLNVDEKDSFFLVKDRMECRIYEEELICG